MRGTAVLFCTDSIGEDAGTERPILELLRDATRREEMGRRSLERCRQRFEIRGAVQRLEDFYAALAAKKGDQP